MPDNIALVPNEKALRLINHGPTVLVSSRYNGISDVMAASWVCALDFSPLKLTLVIDKMSKTRELIEQSGSFVIQVPNLDQLQLTYDVGNSSLFTEPNKLQKCHVKLFEIADYDLPFVDGCSAWLVCKVIPEANNQQKYDLFIGEVLAAWADNRIFNNGHWQFETAEAKWRSLHYMAGGHFYTIGDAVKAKIKTQE